MMMPLHWTKESGFTLMEILVTVLILAIGILGVAKLQMTVGVRGNSDAQMQTQASLFINDMSERIRANVVGARAGDYAAINYAGISCATPPVLICSDTINGNAIDCTAAQVAADDSKAWVCAVKAAIPNATASVAASGAGLDVVISWQQQDVDGNQVNKNVSTVVLF